MKIHGHLHGEALSGIRAAAAGLTEKSSLRDVLSRTESERMWECEQVIEAGLNTFVEVGERLIEIRQGRLYRERYATFEEYCRERWQMSARRARQLCSATEVVHNLLPAPAPEGIEGNGNHGSDLDVAAPVRPTSERQMRPLTQLPKDEQREVWKEAAEASGGQVPTAKVVKETIEKRRPKTDSSAPIGVCVQQAAAWMGDGKPWTITQLAEKLNWTLELATEVWDLLCERGQINCGRLVESPQEEFSLDVEEAKNPADAKGEQIMGAANKAFRCMQSLRNLIEPWLEPALNSAIAGLRAFADRYQEGLTKPKTESRKGIRGAGKRDKREEEMNPRPKLTYKAKRKLQNAAAARWKKIKNRGRR